MSKTTARRPSKSAPPRVDDVRAAADLAEQKLRLSQVRLKQRMLNRAARANGKASESRMAYGSYATGPSRQRKGAGGAAIARGGGADWHQDPASMRELRADGQEALRQDELARLIVKSSQRLAIGTGPTIKPNTTSSEFNAKKKKLFHAWANRDFETARMLGYKGERADWGCDVRGLSFLDGMLRQTLKSGITDGDLLFALTETDAATGGGGQVIMVEAERICGPQGVFAAPKFVPGEGGWINGIEFDGKGRAIRAGIAPWNAQQSQPRYGRSDTGPDAIEYASLTDGTAFLYRNPLDETTNQTRGEPGMAAVLAKLDQLKAHDASVVESARIQACLTAIAYTSNPNFWGESLPGINVSETPAAGTDGATTLQDRTIEPGQLNRMGIAEKMEAFNPTQPGAQYGEFTWLQRGTVAADLGNSIKVAMMDATGTNYSGFRAALGLVWQVVELIREEIGRLLRFFEVFKTAQWIRAGMLPMVNDWAEPSSFVFDPMPSLDPMKDAAGLKLQKDNGFASRSEVITKLSGRDREDVDREREEDQQSEEARGLDAATVAAAMAEAAAPDVEEPMNEAPAKK